MPNYPLPITKAEALLAACREKHLRLAVAESCTGGLLAATITEIPGSSDVFDRGFVTYSNEAKTELLGVPAALIEKHGAVSEETARAMAEGALARSSVQLAATITGIAGPGGGGAEKPVGLVYLAVAAAGAATHCERRIFKGNRQDVRRAAVETILDMLLEAAARHHI